jgi:hypothetical protein
MSDPDQNPQVAVEAVQKQRVPKAPKVRPEILQVKLIPSKQKDSKYTIKVEGGKTVHFGQKGASDYTINKHIERKELYIHLVCLSLLSPIAQVSRDCMSHRYRR